MKYWRSTLILVFLVIIFITLVNCVPQGPPTVPRVDDPKAADTKTSEPKSSPIPERDVYKTISYSDELYFFPQIGDEFAKNLVWFLRQHPELTPKIIAPDVEKKKEYALGYFVYFEKVSKPEVINVEASAVNSVTEGASRATTPKK